MFSPAIDQSELSNINQAFSVSEVNTMIADLLTSGLPGFLWVEGEISNYSQATSGHRYLSLKDSGSTISCALFRGQANRISRDVLRTLKNGDKVVIKATLSVYKPRGSYQLIIQDIEPAGFGALAKAFAALKTKLDQAGLTASERKRALPRWPREIAVVTSETGAAIQDVLTTLARRAPFIPVRIFPTLVQGDNAPAQIIAALQQANQSVTAEVILLVRGGGSLEDLMAFNEESVAMTIVNSRLPIVVGVGHETDVSIADFVSDYRAPTPTAAAEIISPDRIALSTALSKQHDQLQNNLNDYLEQRRQSLYAYQRRLQLQHPLQQLQQHSQRLDELSQRLKHDVNVVLNTQQQQLRQWQRGLMAASPQRQLQQLQQALHRQSQQLQWRMISRLEKKQQALEQIHVELQQFHRRFDAILQQFKGLQARLRLLSPLGILHRGYALVFDEQGRLLHNAENAKPQDVLTIRLAQGQLQARVVTKSSS